MSESRTRKIKKKYGKVLELTSIERAGVLDTDKAKEISKYLDGVNVVTPQELAAKQSIRVSLARKILTKYLDDGIFELQHKNGNTEIFSKQ